MTTYRYTDATNTVAHIIDADGVSRSSMLASALPEGVEVLPYVATQEEILAPFLRAMDDLFNSTAQARRYDSRVTCALRAGYPGPFQAEGLAFAQWMDTCNALGYQVMADVLAGNIPMPTVQAFLGMLPSMEWPQ